MSYYANTVLPTLEDVFADVEPPNDKSLAASIIILAGYPDVAKAIGNMSNNDYETAVWDAHLKQIEIDRPQAFVDDPEDKYNNYEYEEGYDNK